MVKTLIDSYSINVFLCFSSPFTFFFPSTIKEEKKNMKRQKKKKIFFFFHMHTKEFILKKKMQKVILVILLLIALVFADGAQQQKEPEYKPSGQHYEPRDEKPLNQLRRHLIRQYDDIRDFFQVNFSIPLFKKFSHNNFFLG